MMPLAMVGTGKTVRVRRVGGSQEIRAHLADLGFVPDTEVAVIQSQGGNLIVGVKDSRLALTREMASRIMVE